MSFQPFKHPVFEAVKQKRLILASTSPRRIQLLQEMGFDNIEVIPSNFPEDLNKADYTARDVSDQLAYKKAYKKAYTNTSQYVKHTAIGKAQAVYDELKQCGGEKDAFIIAADTICVLKDKIYEKPSSKEEQFQNLRTYRDSEEPLVPITAVVIISNGEVYTHLEETAVYVDETLSDAFLQAYVDTTEGLTVAAGVRVQLRGALLFKRIDGDFYNAVGLPMNSTFKLIQKALGVEF